MRPQLSDYIDTKLYPIETKKVSKENAIADIDDLEIGRADVFINYLVSLLQHFLVNLTPD